MARAKKAKSPAREAKRIRRLLRCSPDPDAHVRAWRRSLHDAHIVAWLGTPEALLAEVERLEREDADALAALVAPGVPSSVVRNRLNPLHAALEPSLFEDDPDTRATMREKALALSALHYAEITKSTRGAMEKAASLSERVLAEEPLARASVRREQDAKSKPAKRIETLVHQRIAETLGISVRHVRRVLSRR
jgi:hypothetical protein